MKEDFDKELKELFGKSYWALGNDYKDCLKLIFKINCYAKENTVSASLIGNILYAEKHRIINDVKDFDNFKRKVRTIFNNLEKRKFIVRADKRYLINEKYDDASNLSA